MDPKPLCAFAGDDHLAPRAWVRYPDLTGDSYYSFTQLIDYVVEHDLPLFLLGDVLDVAYPEPYTVKFLVQQIGRLRNSGWYIQGQHEMHKPSAWLELAFTPHC